MPNPLSLPALRVVIAGVREKLAKATPGPWAWEEFPLGDDGRHHWALANGPGEGVVFHQAHWRVDEADAALIASAPTDLTTLADACERLAEENERVREGRKGERDILTRVALAMGYHHPTAIMAVARPDETYGDVLVRTANELYLGGFRPGGKGGGMSAIAGLIDDLVAAAFDAGRSADDDTSAAVHCATVKSALLDALRGRGAGAVERYIPDRHYESVMRPHESGSWVRHADHLTALTAAEAAREAVAGDAVSIAEGYAAMARRMGDIGGERMARSIAQDIRAALFPPAPQGEMQPDEVATPQCNPTGLQDEGVRGE